MFLPITEWNPPISMFVIVSQQHYLILLPLVNIFCIFWKTIIQYPNTQPNVWEVHTVWSKELSISYLQLFSIQCKSPAYHLHGQTQEAPGCIYSCTVPMKQYISDIRVSMLKIDKKTYTFIPESGDLCGNITEFGVAEGSPKPAWWRWSFRHAKFSDIAIQFSRRKLFCFYILLFNDFISFSAKVYEINMCLLLYLSFKIKV